MINSDKKIEKMIENLAASVAKGFNGQNERFEAKFGKFEAKLGEFEGRFDKIDNDIIWIKDVLESHTTTLARLDQERIFSLNYINRLESEITAIKKYLKIA